jgi:hypothetical protein
MVETVRAARELATLDRAALAARSLTIDQGDPPHVDHWTLVLATIHFVREEGAVAALDSVRDALARTGHPVTADGRPHETLTVFVVWAVARLLGAGLTPTQVLWHPLLGTEAPLAWYDRATLQSEEAHAAFVASTLARAGEPSPSPADLD